ncbi:MAG: hypothetical protein JWO31_361 [Phycisphaerales bacterium]|nr:hypothetical protein [Phycisphaerales bacterium]
MPATRPRRPAVRHLPWLALLAVAPGCGLIFGGSPDKANIQLRKDKQELQGKLADADQHTKADQRQIDALRTSRPTVPTLPPERLSKLFVTSGLEFGRLTGGWDADPAAAGDEGLRVYVAPTDADGQPIKMAGSFVVEAFDLADKADPLVGRWTFDIDAAKKSWRGALLDYAYVLSCPWQRRVPAHSELTLKVEFADELTQATFKAQRTVAVKVPPATRPTSLPATTPG